MMWKRLLQYQSCLFAILASSRANTFPSKLTAFCEPSCWRQSIRHNSYTTSMSGAGVANLPKTFSPAFTIMGGSRPVRHLTTRYMNSSGPGNDESSITSIHLEAMKEIIEDVANGGREDSGYVIMDVRGHDEIAQTGKLDDVVHTLPLSFIVEGAFSRDDDEFEEQFGFVKPSLDETLVFTCKAGVRAASAAELAQKAGYTDILAYAGGSNEWFS